MKALGKEEAKAKRRNLKIEKEEKNNIKTLKKLKKIKSEKN